MSRKLLIPFFLPVLVAVLGSGRVATQAMSGTYTLDRSGSGTRNFKTFIEATYNLSRFGVSGPVTIEVANGTYSNTDRWVTTPVPGATSTNRVTFRSKTKHGARIPYDMRPSMGGYFLPVQWIVIDGFQFEQLNTSYSVAGLSLWQNVRSIEVRNCHFDNTYLSIQENAKVEVHHCLFGLSRRQIDIQNCDELSMHHNEFRMSKSRTAIKMYHYPSKRNRTRIYNNLFWGAPYPSSEAILDFQGVQETQLDHNTFAIFSANGWDGDVLHINGRLGLWNDIRNNIFYSEGKYGLLRIEPTLRYIHFFHRNIYWNPNGSRLVTYPRSNQSPITYANLAAWQQATGQDPVGIQADPRLINVTTSPFDLRPRAGSIAIGKAINTPAWVTDDFDGDKRLNPATIGAYESIADFTPFGSGCAGTNNQVPILGHVGSLKHGSTTFAVTLSNAWGGASRSFLAIGGSNSTWGPVRLPFPLGGGCSLLVSPDIVLPFLVINGKSSSFVRIPTAQNLRGAKIHFQWGVVDPAAGGIGLAMTNGATLTL